MAKNVNVDMSGFDRVLREHPEKVDAWLRGVADAMLGDIVLSFGTSPNGETYQRGGVRHVASVEGYPPNVDIGTLRASMNVQPDGALTYRIADGVEYGVLLEEGTERMGARPFVQPVFDDWSGKIESDARQNLDLD